MTESSIVGKCIKVTGECDGTFPKSCIGQLGIIHEVTDLEGDTPPYLIYFTKKHELDNFESQVWGFQAHHFIIIKDV